MKEIVAKKELKKLTAAELKTKVLELEKTLFEKKWKKALGQAEDLAATWKVRKALARAKTFLTQAK